MGEGILGEQVTIAIVSTTLIQWLKSQPWFPFTKFDAPTLNKIFAAVIAITTGIGLHMTFDPLVGDGTLTITGLNWSSVLHSGWATVQQYAYQHFVYWTAIKGGQSPTTTEAEVKAEKRKEERIDEKKA